MGLVAEFAPRNSLARLSFPDKAGNMLGTTNYLRSKIRLQLFFVHPSAIAEFDCRFS